MNAEKITRGQQTRLEILQAAYDLFSQQGYHGTSMRQIAKMAHIALGGLYNHFDSKEDVFREVFLEFHPYHEVLPAMLNAKGETIEEIVPDALNSMLKALEGRPNYMNLVFIEIVEFKSTHVQELFENILPELSQILQQVIIIDKKRLRSIPPFMLLRVFFGLFFGYYLSEALFSPQAPREFQDNAMDYFVDIFLHGALKEA